MVLMNAGCARMCLTTQRSVSHELALSENTDTLRDFEKWREYVKNEEKPFISLYSYQASRYLAQSRSLMWFAIRDGYYGFTDEGRREVLLLLQEEVQLAHKCQNDALWPMNDTERSSCCEDNICADSLNRVLVYIRETKNCRTEARQIRNH